MGVIVSVRQRLPTYEACEMRLHVRREKLHIAQSNTRRKRLEMNNSSVDAVLSREELLAFMLLELPLSAIGLVVNGIIVYLYVRYATLRAEGGVHMMALLAFFDLLHSATKLHVCLQCFASKSDSKSR